MWDDLLPLDLLSHIFSFLPPHSLARAISTCKRWRTTALLHPPPARHFPPWFLAMPARSSPSCYAYNPSLSRWHTLPLQFLPHPVRLVAPVGGLLLCKLATFPSLRLLLCNPFTRQFHLLPHLTAPRSNPAIGLIVEPTSFRVYVAGGASGASYEHTLEFYDSRDDEWRRIGPMPVEFAVRLTVWTPNESVYADDGVIYWMTSARAYSVVGFDVGRRRWREVKVPMAERLEWAALVKRRSGRVGLVGGVGVTGEGWVWELGEGDEWAVVGVLPAAEMGRNTKCVGNGEEVYLFRDLGSDMLVWKDQFGIGKEEEEERSWVKGCGSVPNTAIKAVFFHPSLSPSSILLKGGQQCGR